MLDSSSTPKKKIMNGFLDVSDYFKQNKKKNWYKKIFDLNFSREVKLGS